MSLNNLTIRLSNKAKLILLIEVFFFLTWRFSGLAPATIPFGSPIFLIIITLSFYIPSNLERIKWKDMGLTKFKGTDALKAISIGILLSLFSYFFLLPAFEFITNSSFDTSYFEKIRGNISTLFLAIAVSLLYAGLAEELIYRGFLLNRLIALIGNQSYAVTVGVLVSSVVFGLAHSYQGIVGILTSGTIGLILAIVYLEFKKNLWIVIITHAIIDIVAAILIYLGLF